MDRRVAEALLSMAHSRLRNYIIPGLDSSMIATAGEHGCIRLFECSRNHQEQIVPHSHRFDFTCLVIEGQVINRIWTRASYGDEFVRSVLAYQGAPGAYEITVEDEPSLWRFEDAKYKAGDVYQMKAHELHSITFSKGARVLFIEGPKISDKTYIIEPFVNGQRVPLFRVEPWMFNREEPR